jgi:hypothetical protein
MEGEATGEFSDDPVQAFSLRLDRIDRSQVETSGGPDVEATDLRDDAIPECRLTLERTPDRPLPE